MKFGLNSPTNASNNGPAISTSISPGRAPYPSAASFVSNSTAAHTTPMTAASSAFEHARESSASDYVSRQTSTSSRYGQAPPSDQGSAIKNGNGHGRGSLSGIQIPSMAESSGSSVRSPTAQTVTISEHARSNSAAGFNSVITASAIAARSASYFPTPISDARRDAYADGFLPPSASRGPASPVQNISTQPQLFPRVSPYGEAEDRQSGHLPSISHTSSSAKSDPNSSPVQFGSGGLIAQMPADPALAQRWRETYGIHGGADSSSLLSPEDNDHIPDDDVDQQEEDDVWAKVARQQMEKENAKLRPISTLPNEAAEQQLAGAGITYDDLVKYQDDLVRSASTRRAEASALPPVPALPRMPPAEALPPQPKALPPQPTESTPPKLGSPFPDTFASPSNGTFQSAPFQSTPESTTIGKSRGRTISSEMGSVVSTSPSTAFSARPREDSFSTRMGSLTSAATTYPLKRSPSNRSEVMYDVTSSHRPSSPVQRSMSPTGLPTIRDLSLQNGFQPIPPIVDPNRQSMSLSQALEAAMNSTPGSTRTYEGTPIIQEEDMETTGDVTDTTGFNEMDPHERSDLAHSQSYDALQRALSPPPDNGAFSDPGHGRDYREAMRSPPPTFELVDDIAAQAQAATHALKGPDPGLHIPPRRSRLLSRSKSAKKLAKAISGPQLLSTSQRLDHASVITSGDPSLTLKDAPSYGKKNTLPHVQTVFPTPQTPPSNYASPNTNGHLRRSSSFGHSATSASALDRERLLSTPSNAQMDFERLQRSAPTPNLSTREPFERSGTLSRIMSKIGGRQRTKSDVSSQGKIDPFPSFAEAPPLPSQSTASRAVTPITRLSEAFPAGTRKSGITMAIPGAAPSKGLDSPLATPVSASTPVLPAISPPRKSSLKRNMAASPTVPVPPLPSMQSGESLLAPDGRSGERVISSGSKHTAISSNTGESLMDGVSFDYDLTAARLRSEAALMGETSSASQSRSSAAISGDAKVKSARDTIVRRTLIIPSRGVELLDDKRKVSHVG
jgi:hypothetical protein